MTDGPNDELQVEDAAAAADLPGAPAGEAFLGEALAALTPAERDTLERLGGVEHVREAHAPEFFGEFILGV